MHIPNFSGLPILKINKTVMYEFWCDYVNSNYEEEANLCYMGTDSFIVNIKTGDVYEDIANNVEKILTHQFMQLKDRYQKVKIKNNDWITET